MRQLIRNILVAGVMALCVAADGVRASALSDANAGTNALESGDMDRAILLLTRGIQSDDLSEEMLGIAYHHRGIAYQSQGDIARAILDYTNAMRRGNISRELRPRALNNRAICFELLGDLEAALRDLNRAIALRADYADAFVNRANVLRKLRAFPEALRDYQRANGMGYARSLVILQGVAQTYESAGDRAQALRFYRQALAIDPDFPPALERVAALQAQPVQGAARSPQRTVTRTAPNPGTNAYAEAQVAASPDPAGENELRAAIVESAPTLTGSGFTADAVGSDAAPTTSFGDRPSRLRPQFQGPRVQPSAAVPSGSSALATPPFIRRASAGAPTAPTAPAPASSPPASGVFAAQLGAYAAEEFAQRGWEDMAARFRDELAGATPRIVMVELPRKGRVFRLTATGLRSRDEASRLCARLKRRHQACLPIAAQP